MRLDLTLSDLMRSVTPRLATMPPYGRHVGPILAHRQTTFAAGDACLRRVKLVGGTTLMGRATAFAGDLSLPSPIHPRKTTSCSLLVHDITLHAHRKHYPT